MASRGTLLLLVAFAVMAGALTESVSAQQSSFVRRQLAVPMSRGASGSVAAPFCTIKCFTSLLPNCCQNSFPLTGTYFCVNFLIDLLNCGSCGNICVGTLCCSGKCSDILSDPNNCGGCGKPCKGVCKLGFCKYSG